MDVGALLRWYERVKRPLPWRETRDPYALLVSEVMLQQTQAARVVPYYEAFLARFPDAAALAAAPPRDVLEAWSGLGYNRRAALAAAPPRDVLEAWSGLGYNRRALLLQRAAREVAEHGWPDDLEQLPGVGPYTAAAVGSFAWDRQTAAVDTNVRRVLERHDGTFRPPKALAARARELLPPGRAADFNQAMMELGATVCRPRLPRCGDCPVQHGCAADGQGGPQPPPRRRGAERFEDTDRYARGRVLAALISGTACEITGERRERALAGLERDGLVARTPGGEYTV